MKPEPYWSADGLTLLLGDCREVMAGLEPESFDAVVTDPPYDLTSGKKGGTGERSLNLDSPYGRARIGTGGFMGATWDATGVAFDPETWRAVYRVLKPGGWVLAFGATRTWHRLVCAIEDAGFEVRDQAAALTGQDAPGLMWMYGNGFPKSLDVAKAIDKAAGAEREVIATGEPLRRMIPGARQNATGSWVKDDGREFVPTVTEPATAEAAEWDGWGTALKPAWEPIAVARKPLAGTVAQNVLAYGTGALNIDGCRVSAVTGDYAHQPNDLGKRDDETNWRIEARKVPPHDAGRWPSNVLFTHSANCEPAGTAVIPGNIRLNPTVVAARENIAKGAEKERRRGQRGHGNADGTETIEVWDCAPGCPVAELDRQSGVLTSGANPTRRGSDKFRDAYGEFAGQRECEAARGADSGGASRFFPVFKYEPKAPQAERPRLPDGTAHNTVKPLDLMCWLVRLVSRRDALILDPFAGSGTTGEACVVEGRRCVLIERDPRFAELVKVRLSKPIQPGMFDLEAS